ncbi:hypothetical protein [Alteribacillus sp. YIM 98480]|uniref:hypothetical protein n=1 Tax=Alteribacillus sp. YIM 98480 TaxID=2606599 RepID=UPI001E422BA4|nr:hypothetical protein [Alteribacillus sp. YIM 98480]
MILLLIITLFFTFSRSPSEQAKETVEEFYKHEQQGDFAQSWELFHSDMKDKFSKGHYIQDRAHVFMNHFDVTTFSFTLDKPEKIKNWQMNKDSSKLEEVYQVNVIQTFKGKYGNFDISQEVYVVQEDEEWKIVWDYNK